MKIRRKRKYAPPLSHSNLSEQENLASHYDPNGSWTGIPENGDLPIIPDGDVPVQDVDDL